jgi:hypothetical protein
MIQQSTPLKSCLNVAWYWMPACAGMTGSWHPTFVEGAFSKH